MLALKKPVPVAQWVRKLISGARRHFSWRTDTQGKQTDDESGSCSCLVDDNSGCRCSHENDVSNDAYDDSNVNGLVSAQMGVCHVATNQGHKITL